MDECYEDQASKIHALETGLSSDPPMNWRLSSLDRYTLISNSDSHSPQPHRLGREANVFELKEPNYWDIVEAIRVKDPNRLLLTIETWPEYGKYHWTGHRACGVSLPPSEALKIGNRCPKCGGKLTVGVEQRVEELADRPPGYRPPDTPGYIHLLPLQELISVALGVSMGSKRVQTLYSRLLQAFGDEFKVMLEAPIDAIGKVSEPVVAQAIDAVRRDAVKVTPGYDGVYGVIELPRGDPEEPERREGLEGWMP